MKVRFQREEANMLNLFPAEYIRENEDDSCNVYMPMQDTDELGNHINGFGVWRYSSMKEYENIVNMALVDELLRKIQERQTKEYMKSEDIYEIIIHKD